MSNKAVFLDRDGVLNIDRNFVHSFEEWIWVDGAKKALDFLKNEGYTIVVITNQSGIGRGHYTEDHVVELHHWVNERVNNVIEAFYYCPHHPLKAMPMYRKSCGCRKPAPGMIHIAASELDLDLNNSFLIGDSDSDIAAAKSAKIPGFKFNGGNLNHFSRWVVSKLNESKHEFRKFPETGKYYKDLS